MEAYWIYYLSVWFAPPELQIDQSNSLSWYMSVSTWQESVFYCCWVGCSINIISIRHCWLMMLLIFSISFLISCVNFLINFWERGIEHSNSKYGFVYLSFQFYWLLLHLFYNYVMLLVHTYLGLLSFLGRLAFVLLYKSLFTSDNFLHSKV